MVKIIATRCYVFKAKMQRIRFRLGLHPRSHWGCSQRSPIPSSWIQGVLLL